MAVATKVAALGVFLRFFDVALISAQSSWGPALAALATITILVGNVGALGQSSLKRMLAYSSVAQAGYMLAGIVVASKLGAEAMVLYLVVYLMMNMASFAVIVLRERETGLGDSIGAITGLGRERPLLAWPMTISMLALAGIPATAGFIGKFYLIDATVQGGYTWLGVVIVIGSMISLGYYLPVIAAIWMREAPRTGVPAALPARTGGRPAGAGGGIPRAGRAAGAGGSAAGGGAGGDPRGGGDALLRDHPPAAVRPRARSRGGSRRVLSARTGRAVRVGPASRVRGWLERCSTSTASSTSGTSRSRGPGRRWRSCASASPRCDCSRTPPPAAGGRWWPTW